MRRERLLIVDDEADMLEGLRRLLGYELPALEVVTCADPLAAPGLARRARPDAVLLDVKMPGMDGLALLADLKAEDPSLTCIMMTAHGTIEMAVEAIKTGAYDFITKPFRKEQILVAIERALEWQRITRENLELKKQVQEGGSGAGGAGGRRIGGRRGGESAGRGDRRGRGAPAVAGRSPRPPPGRRCPVGA